MSDADEIKSHINIVDFIGKRVTLKKTGRNYKGLCPFHNEKTPSFIVSPERQTFHCFGCGKGGDILAFVMEYDHVDFVEALAEMAEETGVKLTRRVWVTKRVATSSTAESLKGPLKRSGWGTVRTAGILCRLI